MVLLGIRLQTFNLKSLGGKKLVKQMATLILTLFIFITTSSVIVYLLYTYHSEGVNNSYMLR